MITIAIGIIAYSLICVPLAAMFGDMIKTISRCHKPKSQIDRRSA